MLSRLRKSATAPNIDAMPVMAMVWVVFSLAMFIFARSVGVAKSRASSVPAASNPKINPDTPKNVAQRVNFFLLFVLFIFQPFGLCYLYYNTNL